ncbi:hypothetical protein PM082_023081 [Marasmius tenuissimus]|nr:hypothetical protein PM082_023081 [Marasmius tenuissimus]
MNPELFPEAGVNPVEPGALRSAPQQMTRDVTRVCPWPLFTGSTSALESEIEVLWSATSSISIIHPAACIGSWLLGGGVRTHRKTLSTGFHPPAQFPVGHSVYTGQ